MTIAVARSSLRTSLLRYGRSWGLWLLLLVAPVGARYMIPRGDGSGTVIAIGGRLPEMTAPFLGVSLGIVVSTLLLPIGWMYLRSNTTRRQPWQVEEVTAASRVSIALGRWAADAAILLGMLAALTIAGWILAFVVPLVGPRNLLQLTAALWLVAAPALLGVAALRILFDAIPFTRGGWGDFGYFVFWMGSLIMPMAAQDRAPGLVANMYDFAGFIRPLQYGAPGGTDNFAIGGVDNILPGHVRLGGMAGALSPRYIASRLLWVAIAFAVAALAGAVYQPHRATGRIIVPGRLRRWLDGGAPPPAAVAAAPAGAAAIPVFGLLAAEFRLIGAGRLFKLLGAAVAIAALVQDFRHVASPAALLLLIFALTAHAGRSEARGLLLLTNTAPLSPWLRRAAFVVAGTGWSLLLTAPAVLTTPVGTILGYAAATGAIAAGISIALATFTRSAFAPRMVLLVLWYGYLSAA
ncbi:MAG: hypothetical protein H7268_04200 [Sandarakinorhabdus sp.]|nr:hypothetical protein [Sandarakinorhabdus sp.]